MAKTKNVTLGEVALYIAGVCQMIASIILMFVGTADEFAKPFALGLLCFIAADVSYIAHQFSSEPAEGEAK